MATQAYIKNQITHARDPIRVPATAQASAADPYSVAPHHWDHHTRTTFEHYQPNVARPPLAPLGALPSAAEAANNNAANNYQQTLNHRMEDQNPFYPNFGAVTGAHNNLSHHQQQYHTNVNQLNGTSQPNSASVSTIQHNDTMGVNVMPTRAGAVGVAPQSNNNNRFAANDITAATNNTRNVVAAQQQQQQNSSSGGHHKTSVSAAVSASSSASPAANAAVQHLLSQIQFLHKEVERLEGELSTTRQDHAETMRKLFERGMKSGASTSLNSLNASGIDISMIADGSAAGSAAATAAAAAILGPAAATRRLHEHQLQLAAGEAVQLNQRCRNLEAQLAAANAAKTVALNEKIELVNKTKKLEALLKTRKQSLLEVEEDMTTRTAAASDEAAKLKQRLEETQREFIRLAKQLDRANDDLANEQKAKLEQRSRMVSSFVQCGGGSRVGMASDAVINTADGTVSSAAADGSSTTMDDLLLFRRLKDSSTGTEVTQRADACCQVDTTMTRLYGEGIDGINNSAAAADGQQQQSTVNSLNKDLLFMMGMANGEGIGADDVKNQIRAGNGSTTIVDLANAGGLIGSANAFSIPAAATATAVGAVNYNNMAHLLQVRCAELDTARGDLHRLSEAHKETLQFLDVTKKRLTAELDRRKVLENDNEKLALQVRALQQQSSQLSSQIREKDGMIEGLQRDAHEAISTSLRLEQERSNWEAELSANAKDLQNLVTNQNFVHQQLSAVNSENDELRKEVQRLLQLESTNQMAYRAKESEVQEVLQAYQMLIKEGEANVVKSRAIEKEVEMLRAGISVKEERVVHLQEQVASLHAREQQLTLDLQSFDFEGGQLHRKLLNADNTIRQQAAEIHDLQQHQLAFQRIQQELDHNQTQLSKKLVIRDQECMHLRMRCDQLEQECTALSTARFAETHRLKELEDLNAQQRVREVLYKNAATADAEQQLQAMQKEVENLRSLVNEKDAVLATTKQSAEEDRQRVADHLMQLKEVEHLAAVSEGERQRLQRIVEEQAATLEKLAE